MKLSRWTFTYIGADHDVEKIAFSLSITNTMTFNKNDEEMKKMFTKEKMARAKYSSRIRMNEATNADFYEPEDPKK